MNKYNSEWMYAGIVFVVAIVAVIMMVGQNSGFSFGEGSNLLGGAASIKCTDTDGGNNFFVKGTVTRGTTSRTDSCSGKNVVEYYCEAGKIKRTSNACADGCKLGACISTISTVSESSQGYVLRDGETQTYTLNGRDYEVTAVFISTPIVGVKVGLDAPLNDRDVISDPIIIDPKTATAKLSVNGQMTKELGIGYSQIMGGNIKITVKNIVASAIEGSVTFSLEQVAVAMDDLSYYPSQYFASGAFDGKIVVGQIAPTSDVVAAIDIAASLQNGSNGTFPVGIAVLDVDVPNPYILNLISVGNPCNNKVTAKLMGNPDHCLQGFSAGHGIIKLFSNNGKTQIVVAGYGNDDTLVTARVLADYDDYQLKGKLCGVRVYDLNTLEVSCEQTTPETCTDSDFGADYYLKGNTEYGELFNWTDYCSGSQLSEYYCGNIVTDNGYFLLKTPSAAVELRYMSYNAADRTVTIKVLYSGSYITVSVAPDNSFEFVYGGVGYSFQIVPVSSSIINIRAVGATKIILYQLYNCPNGCSNGACLNYTNYTYTKVLEIMNLGSTSNPNAGSALLYGDISKMRDYAASGKRFHVKATVTHYPNNAVYKLVGEPNMVFDCAAYDYSPKTGSVYGGWITCNKIKQTITGSYSSAELWFSLPMSNIYAGQTVIATTKLYTNGVYKVDDSLFVNRAAIYTY